MDINTEVNKFQEITNNGQYSQISYYDKKNNILSYYSYNIGLSTVNFDLSYINDLSSNNSKKYIDKNLLVLSMFDDKMYYNKNSNKSSYQYNNILFINNESDIIPLNLNIKDNNSSLSIINNEIQMNIDQNTIIDKDNQLTSKYDTFNLANNNYCGLFKPDNESLIISNNKLSISDFAENIIDSTNENIEIMKDVIDQCSYNLDKIITDFKEYQLYDQIYSCNINEDHELYYFDEDKNNILMKDITINSETMSNKYMYIDYNQKYFKIKINIIYNYLSGSIYDFNPFDEKYLKITFNYQNLENSESHIYANNPNLDYKMLSNSFIKENKDKSYIFNNEITNFDENTNNIYGEVNYICYFDILNDELYNYLKNIQNKPGCIPFKIEFEYNDIKLNISSKTECFLDLFVDRNYNSLQVHQLLYHDYSVGFNYEKIGNLVGISMITNILDKPIFMKYFNNENNYIINRISNDILKDNSLIDIRCNNQYNGGSTGNTIYPLSKINLISDENIFENKVLYKNFEITNNILDIWKNKDGVNYINKFFNTKNIYKNYIKYAFNNTYNIHGNGLRKGDCYVPCLSELAFFYFYGFYPYISYIEKNEFSNSEPKELDSSTLYIENNKIYLYSIDFSDVNANISIKKEIGLLKVDENGNYVSTSGKTLHRSISLFKLPDYSILFGKDYYLQFDEDINCESLEYITNGPIVLNIKLNNSNRTPIYTDFNFYYIDNTISLSHIKIIKKSETMYQLSFNINKYSKNYNEIDIYYKDSDDSLNDYNINSKEYRRLCKLSIKIR